MTTEKEILELLRSGKNVATIGDEFAAMLNKANNAYQAEQRAKVEEENKVVALADVIDQFIEWYEDYYAPLDHDADSEELARSVIASIDLIDSIGGVYEDLFAQVDKSKNVNKVKNKTIFPDSNSVDDFFSAVQKYLS